MREWFKEARTSKNMTQADLAKQCEISRSFITEIENGKANPHVDNAKKIASVLGFSWTRFYDEESEEISKEVS